MGSAGCGSGLKGLPGGAPPRPSETGDASNHKSNSVSGDQPLARRPSGETRCRPRRPICRADRGSPRACIIGRSGRGGRMAARACEPAGHEGPSRSASLAPCVRARALRKAKHRPGAWPSESPEGPRRNRLFALGSLDSQVKVIKQQRGMDFVPIDFRVEGGSFKKKIFFL